MNPEELQDRLDDLNQMYRDGDAQCILELGSLNDDLYDSDLAVLFDRSNKQYVIADKEETHGHLREISRHDQSANTSHLERARKL